MRVWVSCGFALPAASMILRRALLEITWVSSREALGPPSASSRWRSAMARRRARLALRRAATMRAAWAGSLGAAGAAPDAEIAEAAPPVAALDCSPADAGVPAWEADVPVAATASFVPEIPASSAARRAMRSRLMSLLTVTISRGSMCWAGRAHGSSVTIHEMSCSRRNARRSDRCPEFFAETRTRTVTVYSSESVICTPHVRPSHRSVEVRSCSTLVRMRVMGADQSSLSSTVPSWAAARRVQFSKGVCVK